MRTKIIAKAVIINKYGDILLLRRSKDDDSRAGGQDFPGGGIEVGEDLTAAVCREIFEEAGLEIAMHDIKLFYADTEMAPHGSVVRLVFWVRVQYPVVKLSFEHDQYRWVPPRRVSTEFRHHVYATAVEYGLKHRLFEN